MIEQRRLTMVEAEQADRTSRDDRTGPSFADLLSDLRDDAVMLLKQELALAKLEMSENVRRAGLHIAIVIAGALIGFTGGVLLLLCMAALLAWTLIALGAAPAAAVALGLGIAGLVAAGAGAGLLFYGGQKLKNQRILPESTIDNLKQDVQCIQQRRQ
ncbi:MAG: phage holin family protein [Verrucomicrobiales bacterium]